MFFKKIRVLPLALGSEPEYLPYLAIGMLTAYVREYQGGRLSRYYHIDRVIPAGCAAHPLQAVYKKLDQTPNPVCLFSSYVWNHELNLQVAAKIKKLAPNSLIIFGGPHVPKYLHETESFLKEHDFIDIAVLGEGEAALAEILSALAETTHRQTSFAKLVDVLTGFARKTNHDWDRGKLADVTGIVYSRESGFTRTAERQRIRDICELPSPYLKGEFDPWFDNFPSATLETNRGCPYGCTYCDWGSATLAKVTKFTADRVIAELNYIADNKAERIFIADANFGMLEQDIEIAQALVKIRDRTGYPRRVYTNFAKNGGRRLMEVIKILHEGGLLPTGIIALQTTDPIVLKTIARDNIKTEAYEKMLTYFNAEKIPMASDLMVGLPGQTLDSFAKDLQFCFDWKVSASANFTSMMPNAPMAEPSYRAEHKIVSDSNNMIQSTASFSAADMDEMTRLYNTYQFHVRSGILKYILYYLQIEHGVPAIAFLRRLRECTLESDPDLPVSCRIENEIFYTGSRNQDWAMLFWGDNANFLFENPEAYYEEILAFSEREFGVSLSPSEIRTLKLAQQAVLPHTGRQYPYEVSLEHDIVSYIDQIKQVPSVVKLGGRLKRLSQWSEGKLQVTADTDFIKSTYFKTVHGHGDFWELASPIRFY